MPWLDLGGADGPGDTATALCWMLVLPKCEAGPLAAV